MYKLYSLGTPNGIKPTIMLEELKVPYEITLINIREGEQFTPEFLRISPNNKIPVIYDPEMDFYLFESVAILQYLGEKHHRFLPEELKSRFTVLKWCYFQVGHIGPMFGQYGHFHRYASEDIPYAKKRYADEVLRLMGVMDKQLEQHPYISGTDYTIADMAIWPWLYCYENFYETPISAEQFPNLMQWYKTIGKRPQVKAAIAAYEEP
ncbi:glutathione S-transferase N-terminal domain-containing protein [Legionella maceachernii]|uniref:S-transferase n=1 Tax=Legionella maceachernii TaxID=466 RepID=A0A0W0WHN6_9GAMM|nr:glutathione S-transferase N-terminal domain-containing protein [Legionella maceachernii]KTD31876.1 S-transferase [Legionella maceachernii]SJZ44243.1 glutathione S-transferase [Legionella maceachernii]SUP04173.1 GST-like protein yfcG [Legionella maceachernii]